MTKTNPWVVRRDACPKADIRLFCFPYAGAGALVFSAWRDALPASIEVCPVQLPGRESRWREALFAQFSPLVEALAQGLQPLLDMPFAFFGHSLGALIAFELARWLLQQADQGPVHLFVSGHGAPQASSAPPLYGLPDAELIAELRRFNGTPEAVLQNAELMQLMLPILRADLTLDQTYVYVAGRPLDCGISAFGGFEDAAVSRQDLEAWRIHTRGAFALRLFPGDHFFLHRAQAGLLSAIAGDLCRSWSAAGRVGSR